MFTYQIIENGLWQYELDIEGLKALCESLTIDFGGVLESLGRFGECDVCQFRVIRVWENVSL